MYLSISQCLQPQLKAKMTGGLETARHGSDVLFDVDDGSTFPESYHSLIGQCNSSSMKFV